MTKVFICYSREDKEEIYPLARELEDLGFEVWIDVSGIKGGTNWTSEIVRAIKDCEFFLLFVSSASVCSDNVRREVDLAYKNKKKIVPLRLEKVEIPQDWDYQLIGIQWIECDEHGWKSRLAIALDDKSRTFSSENHLAKNQNKYRETRVRILIDEEISRFNDTRKQDLIGVLAAILSIEEDEILLVRVSPGSILLEFEISRAAKDKLLHLARQQDLRLIEQNIKSITFDLDREKPIEIKLEGIQAYVNSQPNRDNDWWTEESSRRFEDLPERDALEEIISSVQARFNDPDIELIRKAWETACEGHVGQQSTYSARPVTRHLLAVAKTVAELGLDSEAVAAALLHDILEDTLKTPFELNNEFGRRITNIVRAISKYENPSKNQAEPLHQQDILKKLFDALFKDLDNLPAAFIKLAEKYDHLRFSIQHFPYEKRKDMADEVMMGYAPLAERLGVWRLKAELEDLSFRTTNFEEYLTISGQLQRQHDSTEAFLRRAVPLLTGKLTQAGLHPRVTVRRKHIYSTYEKMRRKGKKFIGINDFVGIRIIVDEINECYLAMGTVHELWKPIPGEMDDYIGQPKSNGYQSLHTTVLSNEGFAIEVQIRTAKMHQIAEYGLAAHWRYKDSGDAGDETLNALLSVLQQQLESSQKVSNIEDYLHTLTEDMLQDQIHVYLSAAGNMVSGELISLPKGATPIDLAYSINEELGNNTIGAKLHGSIDVPLDWQLNSGDRVTLFTSEDHDTPEREWFTFVKTIRAKEAIKRFAQKFPPEINLQDGLPVLRKELSIMGIDTPLEELAAATPYARTDELIMDIGSCKLNAREVVEMLFKRPYDDGILDYWTRETLRVKDLQIPSRIIKGECCRPNLSQDLFIIYDPSLTVVHNTKCAEIKKEKYKEKILLASLDTADIILTVRLRVRAKDRVGLLSDITTTLSEASVNITHLEVSIDHLKNLKTIDLEIDINYQVKLIDLLHRIRLIANAENVRRINHNIENPYKWKIATPVIRVESKPENVPSPISVTQETYGLESTDYATVNQRELRKAIEKAFSLGDLVLLCADVEQELLEQGENIHLSLDMFGTNRPIGNIIYDLVQYLYKRDYLDSLIKIIQREQPKLLTNIVKDTKSE